MPKYILFDTETTGADTQDRVIQFGALIVDAKMPTEVFNEFCSTDEPIKLEAMEVHNITQDMIANKPKAIDTKFFRRLNELNNNENYLIAHNISFDLGMIQKEGFECKLKTIDTLRCSKHLFKELPYHRLQYMRYALGLYKDEVEKAQKIGVEIKAHDAIGDVIVMNLLLSKLVARCKEQFAGVNPMEKLVELTNTPVFIEIFKFGKYKGKSTQDIANSDVPYLTWMKNNMELDEDMKYTLSLLLK